MSDTKPTTGWVLTADRKPTADDADETEHVWWWCDSKWVPVRYSSVRAYPNEFLIWHPKPKAEKPEPYKPPERRPLEGWVNIYPDSPSSALHKSIESADKSACSDRIGCVHFREVRDGDPSPEDVEKVRQCIRHVIGDKRDEYICALPIETFKWWLKSLGGTP